MSDERSAWRTVCESRRVCAGLSDALRIDFGWQNDSAGRPQVFAQSTGSRGLGSIGRIGGYLRGLAENRGSAQNTEICGEHHACLSPGAGSTRNAKLVTRNRWFTLRASRSAL